MGLVASPGSPWVRMLFICSVSLQLQRPADRTCCLPLIVGGQPKPSSPNPNLIMSLFSLKSSNICLSLTGIMSKLVSQRRSPPFSPLSCSSRVSHGSPAGQLPWRCLKPLLTCPPPCHSANSLPSSTFISCALEGCSSPLPLL